MNKDLKIKIPRKAAIGSAANYWDLVRRHGTSRKAMVSFICGIGGYSDRSTHYAIEFNIKDYHSDTSVENLWKLVTSAEFDVGPDKDMPPEHLAQVKALFWRVYEEHKEHVYLWGQEEAYEGWAQSDSPYYTFVGDDRVDWKWEVTGRSSGHLCMTECEGHNLQLSPEDLEAQMNELDDGVYLNWSNKDLRSLFIICVQNTVEFNSRAIAAAIEHSAAWRLWVSFCEDEQKEVIEDYDTRKELSDSAGVLLKAINGGTELMTSLPEELIETFKSICKLADVPIGE